MSGCVVFRGVEIASVVGVFDLKQPVERAQLVGLYADGLVERLFVLFRGRKLLFKLSDVRFERVVLL